MGAAPRGHVDPLEGVIMHRIWLPARLVMGAFAATALVVVLGSSAVLAAGPNTSFGFNARDIRGFPSGAVALTGGGAFNSATNFVHSGGGFSCTAPVNQGPLTGCQTGEGVRWDTAGLLSTTQFRCTAPEALRPATTSDDTVVLNADFYRAGDGNDESFTATMIVTTHDLDDTIPGAQNVWVQGVGCGTAVVHFSA
jgi:hypothetical protein